MNVKKLLVLAALALPSSAHALGVGTTYAVGSELASLGAAFGGFGGPVFVSTAPGFYPSLDLHPGPHTVQIHVFETLVNLSESEDLFLGANAYFGVVQVATGGAAAAVVEPGFGVDLLISGDLYLAVTGESRFGLVLPGEASFGVYIVPALGFGLYDGDAEVIYAGTLQFSIWFGQ